MTNEALRLRGLAESNIAKMFSDAIKKEAINLGQGSSDLQPPENVKEAAVRAIEEGYTSYAPAEGFLDLREAVAEKLYTENDVDMRPETEVTITVGSSAGLAAAVLGVVNPSDEVLIFEPFYPTYVALVNFAGGRMVGVPLTGSESRVEQEALQSRITNRTKAVVVNSPNNPTGRVFSREELRIIADLCIDHDIIAITDEVYEKIVFDTHAHYSLASLPGMRERTITCNSFSKTYAMAGFRVGFVAAVKELTEAIRKSHTHLALNAPAPAQKAALAALQGSQDFIKEMQRAYLERRDITMKRLNTLEGISCRIPEGTYYAYPDISGLGIDDSEFVERLLYEQRVAVIPGREFGTAGKNHIRLCFARRLSTLIEGLDAISKLAERLNLPKK